MPTFDFRCAKCDHVFEFSRPFGSSVIPACHECKSKKTEKLISPPAVHFKGGGWYKNDSKPVTKSIEKKEAPKKETDSTTAAEGPKEMKTETKEKKPESPKKAAS